MWGKKKREEKKVGSWKEKQWGISFLLFDEKLEFNMKNYHITIAYIKLGAPAFKLTNIIVGGGNIGKAFSFLEQENWNKVSIDKDLAEAAWAVIGSYGTEPEQLRRYPPQKIGIYSFGCWF